MVGRGVGLHLEACPTRGDGPIGRGIGPALEVRDVLWVLEGHADAPQDLREKALVLRRPHPRLGSGHRHARARPGAGGCNCSTPARRARRCSASWLRRDARDPAPRPSALTQRVTARASGVIREIDGWRIAGIARRAGAPLDKTAGIDLLRKVGDAVTPGEPLYLIHAAAAPDLDAAHQLALQDDGVLTGDPLQRYDQVTGSTGD